MKKLLTKMKNTELLKSLLQKDEGIDLNKEVESSIQSNYLNVVKNREENINLYRLNLQNLLENYENKWIAYDNENVLFSSEEAIEVISFVNENNYSSAYIVKVQKEHKRPSRKSLLRKGPMVNEDSLESEFGIDGYTENEKIYQTKHDTIAKGYSGKWIIFSEEKVQFASDSEEEVQDKAIKLGLWDAYITKVSDTTNVKDWEEE